ncbi:MAG: class F sortase [Actinomycetes bacterium]
MPTAINAGVVTRSAMCPSAAVGGAPVGSITVEGRTVPIKRIDLAADGSLTPPASNKVAGISNDHAALDAQRGATVITWHVRYGPGCDGTLNNLLTAPVGSTFTIKAVNGESVEYRISERVSVPKGDVKASWFSAAGPHRLTLLTCSGLKNGRFTQTTYIGAEPVQSE